MDQKDHSEADRLESRAVVAFQKARMMSSMLGSWRLDVDRLGIACLNLQLTPNYPVQSPLSQEKQRMNRTVASLVLCFHNFGL